MPDGAIYVGRPTDWGNPYQIRRRGGGYEVVGRGKVVWGFAAPMTRRDAAECAVDLYRDIIPPRSIRAREAQIHLAGHDLACWCPLDLPCHADVLLEVANG